MKNQQIINFEILNDMDSYEIRSLLKSNYISRENRQLIKVSLADKLIKEMIPVIAIIGASVVIMDIVMQCLRDKNEK